MHPEKIWIVILILVVVLVGSNLLMFAVARGMRGGEGFKILGDFSKPWKKEDDGLRELSQRVKDLKAKDADENK